MSTCIINSGHFLPTPIIYFTKENSMTDEKKVKVVDLKLVDKATASELFVDCVDEKDLEELLEQAREVAELKETEEDK